MLFLGSRSRTKTRIVSTMNVPMPKRASHQPWFCFAARFSSSGATITNMAAAKISTRAQTCRNQKLLNSATMSKPGMAMQNDADTRSNQPNAVGFKEASGFMGEGLEVAEELYEGR